MKNIILIIILSIFILGCFKDKDIDIDNLKTIVFGKSTNAVTSLPEQGVTIQIEKSKATWDMPISELLDTIKSDSSGSYYYTFYSEKKHYYKVGVYKYDSKYKGTTYSKSIKVGETNNIDIMVKPYKTLMIRIRNLTNKFDKIIIYPAFELIGYKIDEFIFKKTLPEEVNHISWKVSNSDTIQYYTEKLYINYVDTSYFEITY